MHTHPPRTPPEAGRQAERTDQSRLEHWNLFLNLELNALPWPWPGKALTDLAPADIADMPGATSDFLRYSPTDGTTDWVQTPLLPREVPVCRTALAVYHDADWIYVCICAEKPAAPIPELAECANEDFAVVLPTACPGRGVYFGMNQAGEHIGCTQLWDADYPGSQADKADDERPYTNGPSGWRGALLTDHYDAVVIPGDTCLTAVFRLSRKLSDPDSRSGAIRLSAGRTCYATGEWVSWGSPILWSARADCHGHVRLVHALPAVQRPVLRRLDALYDPTDESAVLQGYWQGVDEKTLQTFSQGSYAEYADKVVFALGGQERIQSLTDRTTASFPLIDGWNQIEIMTLPNPVQTVFVEKVSGRELQSASAASGAEMPGLDELSTAFAQWHKTHDQGYRGNGIWSDNPRTAQDKGKPCLCHAGIFHIEPYLLAKGTLDLPPETETRIRETCDRMLAEQKTEGWFPCYCSANDATEPELGDGGAFTNGSVGEGLVLAALALDEPDWLEAARRAADYAWYRWENNQNYAAFALWHLAALHEHDQQPQWLDKALYLARNFVIRDIGLCGAQGGHNHFTGYGNITLKGLARLLSILPDGHDFRPVLRDKTIRFANQILSRQQPDGRFAGRNRKYLGYHHTVSGLFFVADAIPEQLPRLEPALAAMTRAAMAGNERDAESGLVLALAARMTAQGKNVAKALKSA